MLVSIGNPSEATGMFTSYWFAVNDNLLKLDAKTLISHNFTIHHVKINAACYGSSFVAVLVSRWIIQLDNILLVEATKLFSEVESLHAVNYGKGLVHSWSSDRLRRPKLPWIEKQFAKVIAILKGVLALFLMSNLTSMYLYAILIYLPGVTFVQLNLAWIFRPNDDIYYLRQLLIFSRLFPWLGRYVYPQSFNGQKKMALLISAAFAITYILILLVYCSAVTIIAKKLFETPVPGNVELSFLCIWIFMVETASITFLRTRSSIKYYPPLTILGALSFILYTSLTPFGFYELCLLIVTFSNFALLAWILLRFEIPSRDWNESHHYTPTVRRPRTLYFPAFSLAWTYEVPQIWTRFVPLADRRAFSRPELLFVDGDLHGVNQRIFNESRHLYEIQALPPQRPRANQRRASARMDVGLEMRAVRPSGVEEEEKTNYEDSSAPYTRMRD
eukprot:TRINITY_DN5292_c0_g1_i4.p1 TRINITY_DN5292_c0_g1~~TRINITY_DN5292_c0_g1_i4.p1  ORF type:complete len:445 (-),score=51.90 TRINITY_DN5292_c0_g1_i4:105-1439(-)